MQLDSPYLRRYKDKDNREESKDKDILDIYLY